MVKDIMRRLKNLIHQALSIGMQGIPRTFQMDREHGWAPHLATGLNLVFCKCMGLAMRRFRLRIFFEKGNSMRQSR